MIQSERQDARDNEQSSEHRVVLITGAARRIGASIARSLHAAGYSVALHCHRSRGDLDAVIAELETVRTGSTLALQADLADADAPQRLIDATIDRFARLDGLINNASNFYPTPIASATSAQWGDLFATNARAPFFLSQAAAPHLRKSAGAIVNLIDIYAKQPLPDHPIYCMAKAALAMMTKSLARDLAPQVRVNGVAPGAVLLPQAASESGNAEKIRSDLIERIPLQRMGATEDVAAAVLWLLRDARYVTGQIIAVDGGRSLLI